MYDIGVQKAVVYDERAEQLPAGFESQAHPTQSPLKPPHCQPRSENFPSFDLRTQRDHMIVVDLTAIDRIDVLIAQTGMSEIGLDISPWPAVRQFTSWLGLAPQHDVSAGSCCAVGSRRSKIGQRLPCGSRAKASVGLTSGACESSMPPYGAPGSPGRPAPAG
ncbi:MAG TPA: hypothetical protein DEP84_18830 [Chloroflexi bacterium]|nr:hypothetical protein [Chloroflexota bacterium]